MNTNIVIGVDIGGSHITSAAVDLNSLTIMDGSTFSNRVDNKASAESIFLEWSNAINKTISKIPVAEKVYIAFAMPGPFHYRTGLALFEGNDKYENLFNISIKQEFPKYIKGFSATKFRFLNDASSFGVGVSAMGKAKECTKIIAITLGTGFGSCFINNGFPLSKSEDVPKGGCLWDESFKDGIGDDYFSTRWCIKRYRELSGKEVNGVKEIAEENNEYSIALFEEFGNNMAEFMLPFVQKFQPEIIVIGGNISHASSFFLPIIKDKFKKADINIDFEISQVLEDAALIGSSKLFIPEFWTQIKKQLPKN
ncbi:MAG: hypothetical protein RLZZ540_388 [Bacteroidota bacterium]|jgi:glucokinase